MRFIHKREKVAEKRGCSSIELNTGNAVIEKDKSQNSGILHCAHFCVCSRRFSISALVRTTFS